MCAFLSPKETQRRPDTLLFTSVREPPAFHMGVMPYKEPPHETHHEALNKSQYEVPLYLPMQGFKKKRAIDGVSPDENLIGATLQSLPLDSSNREVLYIYHLPLNLRTVQYIRTTTSALLNCLMLVNFFSDTDSYKSQWLIFFSRLCVIILLWGGLVTGVYVLQRFFFFGSRAFVGRCCWMVVVFLMLGSFCCWLLSVA